MDGMEKDLLRLLIAALRSGAAVQLGEMWYGFDDTIRVVTRDGETFGDTIWLTPELPQRFPIQLERLLRRAVEWSPADGAD